MKISKLTLLMLVAAAALSASCKSEFETLLSSSDTQKKFDAAFEYYNAGKYSKAAQVFESLSVQTNGTEKDDTVLFYWGMSNYKFKDYYTAETNFERFVTSYPRSPFAADGQFLRIDCLFRQTLRYELDQTPTTKALNEIAQYLREFPTNEHIDECSEMISELNWRLDTKAYEGAKLYYKMEDYLASRVALVNILKDNAENIYREDILFYIAMSSYKYAKLSVAAKQKERYLIFQDDYLNFIGEYPESKYVKELESLYKRSQVALGKAGVETDTISEKKMEKEREKLERKLNH